MGDDVLLTVEECVLVVIDIQEKLARAMHEKEKFTDNLLRLLQGIKILEIPVIFTEQYPQGLGPTISEVLELLPGEKPIIKKAFSCWRVPEFTIRLQSCGRKQVLLTGIESHVCVYQTAIDLLNAGFGVHAVTDCISSRTAPNRDLGLQRMRDAGARLTSVEMVLFELLKAAEGEKFKAISRIVK